jgi:hypothetical protein
MAFMYMQKLLVYCCLNGVTTSKGLFLKIKVRRIAKIDVTTNGGRNNNVYDPETGLVGRILDENMCMSPDIPIGFRCIIH